MSKNVSVFIEYHIKKSDILSYEKVMNHSVLPLLAEFGAREIQWFVASKEKNSYVEKFILPTVSHYIALKKIRASRNHNAFGCLDHFVDGGIKNISYWVFKRSS